MLHSMTLGMLAVVLGAELMTLVAANDCSGSRCEGSSDSSVLIQQQVHVSESDRSVLQDQIQKPIQEIQAEVDAMVHDAVAGGGSKRPKISKIRNIESMVNKDILPELQATHDAAQKELRELNQVVSTCNRNGTRDLKHIKTVVEPQVAGARQNHSTCRTEEAPLNVSKVTKCALLTRFLTGIASPAVLPTSATPAMMGPYLKAMGEYFCPKHGIFTKLDSNCTTATNTYKSHREICNRKQTEFESNFCTWKVTLKDTCSATSVAYANAVNRYRSKETATKVLEKKWKTEYTGLKKILCYVSVWMGNKDVNSANARTLQSCNGSSVDTTPMNINYPGVPCAIECDTRPVQNSPGTQGFLATYRNLTQAVASVKPCMRAGLLQQDEQVEDQEEGEAEVDDDDDDYDEENEDEHDEEQLEASGSESMAQSYEQTSGHEEAALDQVENDQRGSVAAFPCASHPNAIQVSRNKKTKSYAVKSLNVATGQYANIYSIPRSRSSPHFKTLNSCGINPKDSILYCIMQIKSAMGKDNYLVRIDATKVQFVKLMFSGKKHNSNSGGFGADGTFYYNVIKRHGRGKKANSIYALAHTDRLTGYDNQHQLHFGPGASLTLTQEEASSPTPSPFALAPTPAPTPSVQVSLTGMPITGDFVPVSANFEGTGRATYVLGVMKGGKLLVVRMSPPLRKWQLVSNGHKAGGVHFYGAGWNFQGRVFFANNGGHGVYEVMLSTLNLAKLTVDVQRTCQSAKSSSNDGVNCLNVPAPFKPPQPIAPAKPEQRSAVAPAKPGGACYHESYGTR